MTKRDGNLNSRILAFTLIKRGVKLVEPIKPQGNNLPLNNYVICCAPAYTNGVLTNSDTLETCYD